MFFKGLYEIAPPAFTEHPQSMDAEEFMQAVGEGFQLPCLPHNDFEILISLVWEITFCYPCHYISPWVLGLQYLGPDEGYSLSVLPCPRPQSSGGGVIT